MSNTNCLHGFRCFKCGSDEPFRDRGPLTVYDDGGDDTEDFEWEDASFCECAECGQGGTVADFTGQARP